MSDSTTVWVDGVLSLDGEAMISPLNHGITVGDGVFETMKVVRGEAFALRRHLARLRRSASGLGLVLPMTDDELRAAVNTTIDANQLISGRLRITVTGGTSSLGSDRGPATPTVIVAVAEMPTWSATAEVVTVPWRRNEHSAVAGLKTTSYAENVVALDYAHQHNAHEAILANTAGDLCEGTGSNIFIGLDGRLWTPALSSGCLAGVTRELIVEALDVVEASIPLERLNDADEAFLTSSTRDIQPISRIDDRILSDVPGPLTRQAQAAFAKIEETSLDP